MYTINFVRKRRKELSKVEVQDAKYLKYSILIVGASLAIFLLVIGARMTFSILESTTNASINTLMKNIEAKKEIEEQYVIFMAKVNVLTDLFEQRKQKQEAIAYFSSLFDSTIKISQLNYDGENNLLSFTLSTPSVFKLEYMFETLRSANVKEKYPTYTVSRLGREQLGSYGLAISLPLSTRELPEVGETSTSDQPPEDALQAGDVPANTDTTSPDNADFSSGQSEFQGF